jgi:hypothetical protein
MATAEEDDEHLRLLSIFHFVVAGMGALASLFPVIHLAMGIWIVTVDPSGPGPGQGPAGREEVPRALGWFFIVFASAIILLGLAFSACLAWAGACLRARRRRNFCLVVAGIACMFVPVGTALGIFTILVLLRPGVKARFEGMAPDSGVRA